MLNGLGAEAMTGPALGNSAVFVPTRPASSPRLPYAPLNPTWNAPGLRNVPEKPPSSSPPGKLAPSSPARAEASTFVVAVDVTVTDLRPSTESFDQATS